jgi:fructose-bisphosphate aldolase, class II
MLVSTTKLFSDCYGKYGIAAINVFTMEQVRAVFAAADKAQSPVIIQTTPVARNYATPVMLLSMIQAASLIHPKVVFAMHLDHGVEEHVFHAIEQGGYTSVMIDASHDPFAQNVARTKAVVEKAHAKGIAVEAELGVLSGVEDDLSIEEKNALYTQPDDVVQFVGQTGCDSLAVAVGTSHGAYKFSGGKGLQFEILTSIQQKLPGFPLVLHGGSAVNIQEIQRVNAAGGKLKEGAQGVPDAEIRKAIQLGVCKVNIATDARLLWARTHREFFKDSPEAFDPIVPGKLYMQELEKCFLEKFEVLGSTGKASA